MNKFLVTVSLTFEISATDRAEALRVADDIAQVATQRLCALAWPLPDGDVLREDDIDVGTEVEDL